MNNPAKPLGKAGISEAGAAKSAADSGDSSFAEAIKTIMALPLSDAEKAQAVRRLLAQQTNVEGGN